MLLAMEGRRRAETFDPGLNHHSGGIQRTSQYL
jgi:hypothetical protein